MSDDLYQAAIMALAKSGDGEGRLDGPDASVTLDNPLCGDRVTMDIAVADGRIVEVAHKTRGCILCRAAAAAVARHAPGCDATRLADVATALSAMLAKTGPLPKDAWPDLAVFAPVANHKSRHECVMLPVLAVSQALDQVGKTGD